MCYQVKYTSVKTMEIQRKAQRLVIRHLFVSYLVMIVLKTGKSERSPMRKLHAIDSMLDFKLLAKLFNQIEQNHSSKRWVMFSSCVPKNFRSKSTSTSHSEQNLHFLNSKKKKIEFGKFLRRLLRKIKPEKVSV